MYNLFITHKLSVKISLLLTLIFALSSCSSSLEKLTKYEKDLRVMQNLNGYLALEYLQYSKELANHRDSEYFALKGLMAAKNQEVFAEVLENWPENWQRVLNSNNEEIEQANLARKRLVGLFFDQRARQIFPIQLAHLQLLYDCWISQSPEPNTKPCKALFFKLEDEMHRYLETIKPKTEVKIIPIVEPQFTRFDIYFDLNLNKFNNKADKVFVELFQYLAPLNGDYKILLVGNADRMGKKLYNDVLARNRSLLVRDRLIKNGIPENLIKIKSFGEDNPKIITTTDEQNTNNRRVGIYVLKGDDDISAIPLPLIDNYIYKQDIIKYKKQRGIGNAN